MLQGREEIRKDKVVNAATDSISQRCQRRTAELFFNLIRDGRSIRDALSLVTEAEAPFIHVPNHVDVRDGQITLPEEHRLLGMLQSVQYIPAGEAIMAFDFPRATAVANAYLQTGADRSRLLASLAVTACKFQDDPHNLHPSARPAATGYRAAARRLAEDARRARLLRPLHEGVDQTLKEEQPWLAH